ncbi:kinase-like domain-containing protein [Annulohypoxylon moriforme]|nr:kinase-like domain-containing protein [Annulohypoxylon moriforme]
MFSLIRATLCPIVRNYSLRAYSTLIPGRVLRGRGIIRWDYRILEPLNGSEGRQPSVYKAKIIPDDPSIKAPQWAVIKAATDGRTEWEQDREYDTYQMLADACNPCFRQIYDVIGDDIIVLEWMDCTLADIAYQPHWRIYAIFKEIIKATLTSNIVLAEQGYAYSGFRAESIFVSGINTDHVTVKVGDLARVFPDGKQDETTLPVAVQSPEVVLGLTHTSVSSVWAVATMLLSWIERDLLSVAGTPDFTVDGIWNMLKFTRLFPDQIAPELVPEASEQAIQSHVAPEAESLRDFIRAYLTLKNISTFEEEMQKRDVPKEIKDMLRFMLMVDPDLRPSASSVLASTELQALEKLVEGKSSQ